MLVPALSAQSVFNISNADDASYRDGWVDDTDFDDVGDLTSVGGFDLATGGDTGSAMAVGVISSRERQGLIWFDLPDIPAGEVLDTATFRIFLATTNNVDPGLGSLGPVSLFFDNAENDGSLDAPGFNSGTDSGLDIATTATPTGQYVEVDVTSIVSTDYATDGTGQGFGPVSFFRLEMDNGQAFSAATGNNNYVFQGGDNTSPPELVITTVPEPASAAALFGIGVLALALLRRLLR